MGQVAYGRAEHREALATFRRGRLTTGGSPDEAVLLSWIAVAYRMTGEYQRFRQYVAATVAAADSCADLDARCAARAVQAMLAALDGDAPAAAAYCADGLRAAEAAGNLLQAGRIRVNQAWYLLEQGLATRALAEANAALAVAQRCGYAVLCGVALTIRGGAKLGLGQLGPADRDLILARDLFQNAGSRYAAWPLCGLGQLHRIRGELALAQAAYEEALALTEPTRETLGLSTALSGLARVCAADNIDAARRLAERAVSVGEPIRQVQALLTRGWVALLADDAAAARADADLAGAAARARRDRPGLAEALTLTALSDHGRGDQADLLDEVTGLWRSAGYPLDLAQARLVAAHLAGAPRGPDAALARRTLRYHGVAHGSRCAAGPLAAILRGSPAIAVRALGHFRVLRDGRPLPAGCWQSKKARDLFKILIAARGQPVPRDKLMELLWPQDNRRRTANRLSVLLSTLRTVLHPDRHATDPGPVIAENGAVRLDLDQVELDVERFLVAAHRAVDTTGPEQLALLLEAQKWYTGPFLADDPYHDWAVDVSEEVKAAYSAVLRPLAAQLRAAGDVDRAVRYTLRLLAEDRYDEPAHLDLINTLLDAGRRGEARRWYRIYRQRMRDLGVPPHPYPTERGVGPLA
jgi:DNA-binding SARP family transcriptional activator